MQSGPDLSHVVPQRTNYDCLVAALATVQGWSYEKARGIVGDHTTKGGTYLMPLPRALLSEGIAATWLVSKDHPILTKEHAGIERTRMLAPPAELRAALPGRRAIVLTPGEGPNGETGPQWAHAIAWDGERAINCGATGEEPRPPRVGPLEDAEVWEALLLTDMPQQPAKPVEIAPTADADGTDLARLFDRFERVFLGFSGGKESIVLAHMLEPWRERVSLLWVNTGFMAAHMVWFVRAYGERFDLIELASPDLREHWRAFGPPSDVAPLANVAGYRQPRLQPWQSCCYALRQAPINAFLQDQVGPTCFANGQRRQDEGGATIDAMRSKMPSSVEVVMPLAGWSKEDIFAYVERHGLVLPEQYADGYPDSIECTICPAQMWKPRVDYLRRSYPGALPMIQAAARVGMDESARALIAMHDALSDQQGVTHG